MIRMHQPGSEPLEIPEQIPNPARVPRTVPAPQVPAPPKPVKVPERVTFSPGIRQGFFHD